jgi:copper chaperone CopZ
MKCEACANGLKNALESLGEGVHADVLFDEGMVYVKEEGKATMALMGKEEAQAALERGIAEVMDERGYTSERVCVQQQGQQQGETEGIRGEEEEAACHNTARP